jgi:hypothetical protein
MLNKIFKQNWFVWLVHIVIVVGLLSNGFYTLENFRVNKNNQQITDQKTELEQDKKNLMDQNSFEFLDSYKQKMVKAAGFKYAGEEIFDIGAIDTKKPNSTNTNQIPNYQKWYKCLFTNSLQDKVQGNNQQLVSNNLCR